MEDACGTSTTRKRFALILAVGLSTLLFVLVGGVRVLARSSVGWRRTDPGPSPQTNSISLETGGEFLFDIDIEEDEMATTAPVRGKYADYADQLRENPGRWAKYPGAAKSPTGTLHHLQHGNHGPSFPPDEFEFRRVGDEIHVRAKKTR